MAKKDLRKGQRSRPTIPLPKINTTPEKLAKELLKQRPLREVEQERQREDG